MRRTMDQSSIDSFKVRKDSWTGKWAKFSKIIKHLRITGMKIGKQTKNITDLISYILVIFFQRSHFRMNYSDIL